MWEWTGLVQTWNVVSEPGRQAAQSLSQISDEIIRPAAEIWSAALSRWEMRWTFMFMMSSPSVYGYRKGWQMGVNTEGGYLWLHEHAGFALLRCWLIVVSLLIDCIAQISAKWLSAWMEVEVDVGVHMVFPLIMGIEREDRQEWTVLQTWKGGMASWPH